MSMTTFFQFTETSYLPLPTPRLAQTPSASPPTSTTTTTNPNPDPLSFTAPGGPALPQESSSEILQRGLKTALSMLHSPELMIAVNPLVQHYERVQPDDPANAKRLVNIKRYAPEFNVHVPTPHSVPSWNDSVKGEFVHYEITDKFNLLFNSVSKLMTYRACFRPLYPDTSAPLSSTHIKGTPERPGSIGLETISDPGNGISLLGKWMVSTDDSKPGFIVLTESVNVHCGLVFGWFVRSQLESAHAQLHKEFGRRFVQQMIQGDPLRGKDYRGGKSWGEVSRAGLERVASGGSVGSVGARMPRVESAGQAQGQGQEQWRDKEMDNDSKKRETRNRDDRDWRTTSDRDNDRDELVSSIGDDHDGVSSIGIGGADVHPAPAGLRRTMTNDSDVSDMHSSK